MFFSTTIQYKTFLKTVSSKRLIVPAEIWWKPWSVIEKILTIFCLHVSCLENQYITKSNQSCDMPVIN